MAAASTHIDEVRLRLREVDDAYLCAIKSTCGVDLLSPKSESELKSALHRLAREVSGHASTHVRARQDIVQSFYRQECDELRKRYFWQLLWAFLSRASSGLALSPITGFVLFLLSLRFWFIWALVAWGIWARYGAWIPANLPTFGAYCALVLTCAGLCYSTFRVLNNFGFSWAFTDQELSADQFASFKLDDDFVSCSMRSITVPNRPVRRVIAKDQVAVESPALAGYRGGLVTQSLSGALAGLVINIGLQVWESMSAESRRASAQEAADKLYADEIRAYEAKMAEWSRLSQLHKNRVVHDDASRCIQMLSARVRKNHELDGDLDVCMKFVAAKEKLAQEALCLATLRHLLPGKD